MTFTSNNIVTQTDVLREIIKRENAGDNGCTTKDMCERFNQTNSLMGRKLANLIFGKLIRSERIGFYVSTAKGRKLIADGKEVKPGPKPGRAQRPRQTNRNSLRARLWRAMITLKRFTISEIVQRAAIETDGNPIASARRFVNYLARSGYLIVLPRRRRDGKHSSNGEKIFWLKESFGRLPPRARNKAGVAGMFDPNNNSWRPFKDSAGEAA